MSEMDDKRFGLLLHGQVGLVQMPPILTIQQAQSFREFFEQLCQTQSQLQQVILDFGQTTFIDSSGIGALIRSMTLAKQADLEWTCWSFSPQVKHILSLAGLGDSLPMEAGSDALFAEVETQQPIGIADASTATATHPAYASKLKRTMDILGGLVGLGITGVLFVPLAIAIKLDSPGPILFRQIRRGYLGKPFWIWKFRSMVQDAERLKYQVKNQAAGNFFKSETDPRITKVGRLLRKTSLDEFPQFWNVLKGEMSLVGTRPPTFEEVAQYDLAEWQRLNVKPGITGEWQVNGRSKIKDFDQVVQLDLQYQRNWSLLYDIKLLIKTVTVLFTKDSGAF
jgi:anti-anti-sigma factor